MTQEEERVIDIVKKSSPAVVNIIISEKKRKIPSLSGISKKNKQNIIGGGSGFIISENGIILTNRHVVADRNDDYVVELQNGDKHDAKIIAKDQINDIAILKIKAENLPFLELGSSKNLKLGQTIITIGNALSKFHNSISKGIISGLLRVVSTEGNEDNTAQNLRGLIQTDAAINLGNSGGPMLDTEGKVIGINSVVVAGAENISFAIPVSGARKDIKDMEKFDKIIQPSLGVRYVIINEEFQEKYKLPVSYGAWIIREHLPHDHAVTPGSSAEKAGIKEDDIILEFNGIKISDGIGLDELVQKTNISDKVRVKILRNKKEKIVNAIIQEKR